MLGSQTGGKNPFVAAETVNPTIEMEPFYHAQGMAVHTDILTYNNIGDATTITIPENEVWFMYAWAMQVVATATTDRATFIQQISRLPRTSTPTLAATVGHLILDALNAATIMADVTRFPVPIPLTAGEELITTCASVSGAQTGTISVLHAKFTA